MTGFNNDPFHFTGDSNGFTTEAAFLFEVVCMAVPGMNQLSSPVKRTSLSLLVLVDLGIKGIV